MSSSDTMAETVDCLIVGGGPAGLTAAIYLARFHMSVAVVDAGRSRALLIPLTHNHAGFPEGISGWELVARMRRHASKYGAILIDDEVQALARSPLHFTAALASGATIRGNAVLLATGVVNRRPPMIDDDTHDAALAGGQLRYCPVCDGYEVTDQRIAVMGKGERGCDEAMFLRGYSADVTLVSPECDDELSPDQRAMLSEAGVSVFAGCRGIKLAGDKIRLECEDGDLTFDSLYPALGSEIRSELAGKLGAKRSDEGCLTVDMHQRTSVPGLFAAGDVVLGLDQISHAMGEGGVAATTIRNDKARQAPLLR